MTSGHDVCLPLLSVSRESYLECFYQYHRYRTTSSTDHVPNLRTSDQVLGSVIIFCSVMGLLGNILAFCYFWRGRCKTIPDLLYLAISATDILSVTIFSLAGISLLNDRKPMLFDNKVFCTVYSSVIIFTARMSMFLAMMICITRTIAMKYPFFHIKRSWLIGAISGYAGYMIVMYLIYLPQKWHYAQYAKVRSFCCIVYLNFYYAPVFAAYFGVISLFLELTLPSLVTFVCFCISTFVLITRPAVGNEDENKFRRVSVTIAIFTAVFLICNIPCFLYLMLEFLVLERHYFEVFSGDRAYLKYYSQLMMQFFPVFLNAAINPLFYLLRMRKYQNWIHQTLKNLKDSITHLTT